MRTHTVSPGTPDNTTDPEAATRFGPTPDDEILELIALRALPTAVRCRSLEGETITYRRSLAGIVPGTCLTVVPERRWTFRRTDMVGGELRHAAVSLRALARAGFALPLATRDGLACPGLDDERLREGLREMSTGEWLAARGLLLDVLAEQPGCLVAHAAVGELLSELQHRRDAFAHFATAVRLGLGALCREGCLPLDAGGLAEAALLGALAGRARLHAAEGRPEAAAGDLRRALSFDPTDRVGARALLHELSAVAPDAPL